MPESCTCGAQLPPDARFCHKCGKPQRVEPLLEEQTVEPVLTPEPAVKAAVAPLTDISFRNLAAVRVAFLAAGIASLLISLPMPVYLAIVWMLAGLLAGGFLSVLFYQRRTGQSLSMRGGARMGWITGVFCFAIAVVFFTVSIVLITSKGGLAAFYREQFNARGAPPANVKPFLELIETPAGLATVLLFSLFFLFLLFTIVPTVGGALGAKVLDKQRT